MWKQVTKKLLVLFILVAVLGCSKVAQPNEALQPAKVVGVIDGDTIDVEVNKVIQRVRLIGIDCPEITGGKNEYMGPEAAKFVSELVLGKTVYLERDVSEKDQFGRLLRYVWLVDSNTDMQKMLNAMLVMEGLAKAVRYPPDLKYTETFEVLQDQAMAENKGMWKKREPVVRPIEVISHTKSVKRGSMASIKIRGTANVQYNCMVRYKSGFSTAAGLGTKTADEEGFVSWTWRVGGNTTRGSWPIIITNLSDKNDAVTVYFTVY